MTLAWPGIVSLKYHITGTQQCVLDWSGNQDDYSDSYPVSTAETWDQGLSAGIWCSSTGSPQTYVWKLTATMGTVARHSSRLKPVCPLKGTVLACVKMPCVLLVGEANFSMNWFYV